MAFRFICECGRVKDYRSLDMGMHFFHRHSCDRTQQLREREERVAQRAASRVGGEVRDCQHKYAEHQHGTRLAYVRDKCRCLPCLDATVAYEAYRTRQIAYGRWNHRVDASPVRDRLLVLGEQGIGYKQVSRLTGISATTLGTLIYGRHDRRNGEPPRTISREHADLILGLNPDPLRMSDGHRIDVTGTRRRLQALVALGWSIQRIGEQLGVQRANMTRFFTQQQVQVRYARAVAELYEKWSDSEPVCATRFEQAGVTRAKRLAADRGWLPPIMWDDIDDPLERPDGTPLIGPACVECLHPTCTRVRGRLDDGVDDVIIDRLLSGQWTPHSRAERLEVVRQLTGRGRSANEIGQIVHRTARQVQRDRDELGLTHADAQSA